MKKKLYDVLGVKEDASDEQIKKAYRERAKKTHPDAGGNREEFSDVATAYAVLKNPIKRKEYDKTGDTPNGNIQPSITILACQQVLQSFLGIIDGAEIEEIVVKDIVSLINSDLWEKINSGKAQIKNVKKVLKKHEKILTKIKYKGDREDFISNELIRRIAAGKEVLKSAGKEVAVLNKAVCMVDLYEWVPDMPSFVDNSPLFNNPTNYKGRGFYNPFSGGC